MTSLRRRLIILLCLLVVAIALRIRFGDAVGGRLWSVALAPSVASPTPPAAPTRILPATPAQNAPTAQATPAPSTGAIATPPGGSYVDLAATDPRFGVDEAYLQAGRADALGARWSRIPFIWDYLQPGGPGSWNSFALSSRGNDAVVDGELARGRAVVGLLVGTAGWAQRTPAWGRASVPRTLDRAWNDPQNYWAAYCYRLARRYAGRIDAWVIWNEVSIPTGANGSLGLWTQWHGTLPQYARLLEVAYRAIKAANPAATVVLYGDPYWYDHGAYLTRLFDALSRADPTGQYHGYFDVANLHLYSNPTDFYGIVGGVRALLEAHGWGKKPIWISETNAEPYDDPTHPAPHTNFRVSLQTQAAFLVDAFAVDLAAGVARIEVYRMYDGAETAHGLPAWGLIDNAGRARPIARTFHFLVRLFKAARGASYTPGDQFDHKGGVFKVVLRKPGATITVLWNQARDRATYLLPAHAATATRYDKFGAPHTLTAQHGSYRLALAAGTDFTNPFDPRIPTVGGDPAIVVEAA